MYMRKIAKNKILNSFVAVATIVWAVGLVGILTPFMPAQAVGPVTVVSESWIPESENVMIMGNWMSPVAAFKITSSQALTLNSMKVNFYDVNNGGLLPSDVLSTFNDTGTPTDDQQ